MTGNEMIEDKRSKGYQMGEADEAAVDKFLAGTVGATTKQLTTIRDRLLRAIDGNVKIGGESLPTMAAAADRLTAIIEG